MSLIDTQRNYDYVEKLLEQNNMQIMTMHRVIDIWQNNCHE